jgi:hypothetical protein
MIATRAINSPLEFEILNSFTNTYSLDFDGVDDFVDVGSLSNLQNATEFSVSSWFKTPLAAVQGVWVWQDGADGWLELNCSADGSMVANVTRFSSATYGIAAAGTLTSDTWYNATVIFNGGGATNADRLKLYVNGNPITLTFIGTIPTQTGTMLSSGLHIGERFTGQNYFNGNIDEVSIFDSAISIGDVWDGSGQPTDLSLLAAPPTNWFRMGDNGAYKSPQWLIPNNENKDKASNYSYEFDGVDDYIELGSLSNLQNATEYSICSWFKTPLNNQYQVIYSWFDGADGYLQLLLVDDGSFIVYNYRTSSAYGVSSSGIVSADTWYNALVVFDGSGATNADRLKVYINGSLITLTYTGTIPTQTGTMLGNGLHFGAYVTTSGTFTWALEGNIDEVSIFDSAISIGDVWDGSGEPIDVSAVSGLTQNYRMGEEATFSGGVWTVPDQVGSNDGTSNAMTIEDRVGEAPNSDNNALSYNMDLVDRTTDVPT